MHHQSDGMVERFNSTLEANLKMYVHDIRLTTIAIYHCFLLAYRSSIYETAGQASDSTEDYVQQLGECLLDIHRTIRTKMSNRMNRYRQRARSKGFNEGDMVWMTILYDAGVQITKSKEENI